jgi:hypothetical protein
MFQGELDPEFAVARFENLPIFPQKKFCRSAAAFCVVFDQ